jgi:hypothetical protein
MRPLDRKGKDRVVGHVIMPTSERRSEVRFALDSPVEGDGFELSVPREMGTVSSVRFVTFLEIPMASDVMTVVLQIRPPHA